MMTFRELSVFATSAFFGIAIAPTISAAQSTKPAPAVVVLEFKIKDAEGFKEYASKSPATVAAHGGKFVVRPGKIVTVSGGAPTGPYAVLSFDSVDQAQKWASSPEYAALLPLRDKSADTRLLIAEGVAAP